MDNINPDHYKNSTSLECIETMEICFGEQAAYNFCVLNAFKYIWRWKNKNGEEDLKKAKWYLDRSDEYCREEFCEIVDQMNSYIKRQKE